VPEVPRRCPGPVPRGHKIATRAIATGETVIRYGQIIGQATAPIAAPASMSTPTTSAWARMSRTMPFHRPAPPARRWRAATFMGYHRADGGVGTRNYLGILTSVNCSGSVARFIAEGGREGGLASEFPNVDGVVPIVHGTGCGMSGRDEGYDTLFRTLKGYARNPNFGGILLVGLGCEVMQIPDLIGKGGCARTATSAT
jgi:altronate dehydratase